MSRADTAVDPRDPHGHKAEEFKEMDSNADGFLTPEELESGLLDRGHDPEAVSDIFEKLDVEKEGRISLDHFIAGWDAAAAGQIPMRLIYWRVKSRGFLIQVVAAHAEMRNFSWDGAAASVPDDWKPDAAFGQLPVAVFGSKLKIAQSMAIVRFIARKMGIDGENDWDFAMSEMLLEQYSDLWAEASRAQDADKRKEAWDAYFQTTFAKGIMHVEDLLNVQTTFCSKVCVGELAIACLCNVMLDLEPSCLDATPKLQDFYRTMQSKPRIDKWLGPKSNLHQHFSRE